MPIRPSSSKVRTKRYFGELLITSFRDKTTTEEAVEPHAEWTNTDFGLSAALAHKGASVNSKIRIRRSIIFCPNTDFRRKPISILDPDS